MPKIKKIKKNPSHEIQNPDPIRQSKRIFSIKPRKKGPHSQSSYALNLKSTQFSPPEAAPGTSRIYPF